MSSEDHPDWWRPMGGQNSQDSILERRSLVWNDNDVEAPDAPPANYTEITDKGKFFPRGCRGMLEQLQIYCIRTGVGTLTLAFSPHPCIGPLYTVTLFPGATWAWVAAGFEEMWNYDSLFIWIDNCSADVSWGYDTELPYDGHRSQDGEATWEDMAIRPFIRAIYTGETPGDVPVSGIVNVIPIPNTGLESAVAAIPNVPSGAWTDITTAIGAGELIQVEMLFQTAVVPAAGVEYMLSIDADGLAGIVVRQRQVTQSIIATAGRCAMGEFYQDATSTRLFVRLPIQYRRRLLVRAYQSSGGPITVAATVVSNELV